MKNLKLLGFVFLAVLFVAGVSYAQDCCESKTQGDEKCPVTGKTGGKCTAGSKASAESCCGSAKADAKSCSTTLVRHEGNQTVCPVSNAKVSKAIYVDYKGKRVYLGCNACPDLFKKNPDAYIGKMEAKGIVFTSVGMPQTVCLVSGGKITKKTYVDYKGKRVYLGCDGCVAKFKKNPEPYMKKGNADGIVFASLQTVCPVGDCKITKEIYVNYKGKRVYLGGDGCVAKFKKNPDAYMKKAAANNIVFVSAPGAVMTLKKVEKESCGTSECSGDCGGDCSGDCGGDCETKTSAKKEGSCCGTCGSGTKK